MIVVADASPLIALSRVGRLTLLQSLYGRIYVPVAVWHELVVDGRGRAGAEMVGDCDWIESRSATDREMVAILETTLDPGESEAIALAKEMHADFLLLDEALGRAAAQHMGLKTTGLLGVLLEAKRRGVLPDAYELASAMKAEGWWVSDALLERLR